MEEKSRVNMINAKFAFIFINPCFGTHAWHLPSLSHQFAPQFLHKLCQQEQICANSFFCRGYPRLITSHYPIFVITSSCNCSLISRVLFLTIIRTYIRFFFIINKSYCLTSKFTITKFLLKSAISCDSANAGFNAAKVILINSE